MKSKSTATVLAFFLGGLGVHKFYLGKTSQGILYLVFCITFIPAILALVDFFILLFMDQRTFDYKYNSGAAPYSTHQPSSMSNSVHIINGSESDLDKLEKLARLRDSGVISDADFEIKKSQLLS